jgi:acetyl esterase/lipase
MRGLERRAALLALAGASLSACSGLQTLNTVNALVPGDRGVRRVAQGEAFGGDARQTLDVYVPQSASGPTPVLVFYYGGSWESGRRQDYTFIGEAFGARGFTVVIPDYRLVPQVRFPGFVEDGAKALGWVRTNIARLGGDPARIAIAGHSAGAYNALMLALDEQWLKAEQLPPSLIRAVVGIAGPYDFYPFDMKVTQNAFGAFADPQATQPIHFARANAPPALLAAGLKDTLVKPRNSEALASALWRKGARTELKLYPDLDHIDILLALSKPFRSEAPVLEDVVGFLKSAV